jgi:RNA polymerase sigma factor (sigma-70 family)
MGRSAFESRPAATEPGRPRLAPERVHAALEVRHAHGPVLRRVARRHSLGPEDADDALQRAAEILLTRAPTTEPNRLIAWMAVVTKHEALAVRRSRERLLTCLAPAGPPGRPPPDPLEAVAAEAPGPAERVQRSEQLAADRVALAELKANERLALVLQAEGYSYAEICELCNWSYTKVNRCLAEGRAALRARDRIFAVGEKARVTRKTG